MTALPEKESIKNILKIQKIQENRMMFPQQLHHHEKNVNMLAFNSAETLMATCSADGKVNIYNAINFQMVNQYKFTVAIKYICFSKTDHIVLGSIFTNVYVINPYFIQNDQTIEHLEVGEAGILCIDLTYSNKLLGILVKPMDNSGDSELAIRLYSYPRLEQLGKKVSLEELKFKEIQAANLRKFKFYLIDEVVFAVVGTQLRKYVTDKSTDEPQAALDLGDECIVRGMTASPKFELLLLSYSEGVKVVDPERLTVFRTVETKYPVNCAQISALMYASRPKYHLIFGGGIEAVLQAQRQEGGNQIFIYNVATEEKIGEVRGSYGNINWVLVFKDGSGFITAGEEGIVRVYRFDLSYYNEED